MNLIKGWFCNIVKIDCLYKMNLISGYNIPYVDKITLNINSLTINNNQFKFLYLITAFVLISNQKPVIYKTCKDIKNTRLKANSFLNIRITLRKNKAFEFLYIIVSLMIPHVKRLNLNNVVKISSFSINLNNISIFPQLTGCYNKSLYQIITFTFTFNLFTLNVLKLLITSLHITYS